MKESSIEVVPDEPYRADLVARLSRAVQEGRYRPDARAVAAAMVDLIDTLEEVPG